MKTKMSFLPKATFVFALTLASGVSFAGVGSSGGGSAIVCRDANQNILSAQMYDLYEGQNYFGYSVTSSAVRAETQLTTAVQRLNMNTYAAPYVIQTANKILEKIQFLPESVVLAMPSDMGDDYPVIHPVGCAIEGIGFYTSDDHLKVSRSVYNAFSNTDKAAFILHETLYQLVRAFGFDRQYANSEIPRHLNSALFAQGSVPAEVKDLMDIVLNPDWFRPEQTLFLDGAALSHLTVEMSTADTRAQDFQFQNFTCGQSPRFESISYGTAQTSVAGAAQVQLEDQNCFNLIGEMKLVSPFPSAQGQTPPVQFTLKVYSQGQLISTTHPEVGNGYSGGFSFTVVHRDVTLNPLP